MANTIFQQPQLPIPALGDVVPLGHQADGKGYSVTLQALQSVIGGGGGSTNISTTTSFGGLIYQFGNYVFQQLPTTGATAVSAAMNAMCTAMAAANPLGGEAWIPQVNYPINFQSGGYPIADQSVLRGLGTGGRHGGGSGAPNSYHFSAAGDGLLFTSTGTHTSGGVQFWNLSVNAASPTQTSTCAFFCDRWNDRITKCNIINFPVGAVFGALSSGIEQTVVEYDWPHSASTPGGSGTTTVNGTLVPQVTAGVYAGTQPTMAILSNPECYIMGPAEWAQTPQASSGPSYVVGVGLGNTSSGSGGFGGTVEHSVVRDIHLSDFQWAISYVFNPGVINSTTVAAGGGTVRASNVSGVEAQSFGSAVLMMTPTSGAEIFGEKYIGCTFVKSNGSTDNSAIIYIDATTNGGSNANISDIEFTNCTVFNQSSGGLSGCHGYNIFTAQDVRIIGGTVANMGTNGANIKISGTTGRVLINSVRLGANYPNANTSLTSAYALYVTAIPAQNVVVQNCTMDGSFGTQAVAVNPIMATGSLYISNCIGYNDQNTVLLSGGGSTPTSVTSASLTAITGSTGYFGPSLIFGQNVGTNTTITVNGHAVVCPANGFFSYYLNSPYDTVNFSQTAATFFWIGK